MGRTGTKRDKKGVAKAGAERTFSNWLASFNMYLNLVGAAYPDRAWHLINHQGNVLRARALSRDGPAMDYDEIFQRRASHNDLARWDVKNNDIWLETVGPYARPRGRQNGGSWVGAEMR